MSGTFVSFGRSTVAALALAGSLGALTPAFAKDAPKATNSAEFSKVAGPFQKIYGEVEAKKGKVSPEELKAAATPLLPELAKLEGSVKNPLDRLIYGDWEQRIGGWVNDNSLIAKGLQNMLDSGQLQPAQVAQVGALLGQLSYIGKDYPTAIKYLTPLISNAASDPVVPQMLADSYVSIDQPKQGLEALKTAIAARKAANVAIPEDFYSRGNRIAYTAKLPAETTEWALLLVQAYPTPMNWLGATQLVRNSATNFGNPEELDVSRLMDLTGALKLDVKFVKPEYVAYLQAIDARRFPGEAVRITEQGIALGALSAEDPFVKDSLAQARARLTADKASLPGLAKEATTAPSGKVALAAADTFLSYGDGAKADELYSLALSKGGVDADKDRLLTRQGMAQIEEGKYADAKATLAKVGGSRTGIAQLWTIYADQKAAGK